MANFYAWKHDKTIGITATTITAAEILFLIIIWIAYRMKYTNKLVKFCTVVLILLVLALHSIAWEYSWRHDTISSIVVAILCLSPNIAHTIVDPFATTAFIRYLFF